jgi:hypothetical protein
VGMQGSSITWVNGKGAWGGLAFAGHYDLALQRDAVWNLPPVTITTPVESKSWWRLLRGAPAAAPQTGATAVPDGGGTAALLGIALVSLALVWGILSHRRLHGRRSGQVPKS